MEYLTLALLALPALGYGWYRTWLLLAAERVSVKPASVFVGKFEMALKGDFFPELVKAYRSHGAGVDLVASWLKNEYVSSLEAMRSETSKDDMIRKQGAAAAILKAYNVVETARIQAAKN
jgi:hypothetical protein